MNANDAERIPRGSSLPLMLNPMIRTVRLLHPALPFPSPKPLPKRINCPLAKFREASFKDRLDLRRSLAMESRIPSAMSDQRVEVLSVGVG